MSATNTTHLFWIGRWIEVRRDRPDSWTFKNGRDAADWLLYGRPEHS